MPRHKRADGRSALPLSGALVPTGSVLSVIAETNRPDGNRFYRLRLLPP